MSTILKQLSYFVTELPRRAARGLRRLGCGCLLALLLLLAVLIAVVALFTATVAADDTGPVGFLLYFVNDESASVNEPGGSDPLRMRAAATAMLIRYLGLESGDGATPPHAVALIHFGTMPHFVAPPTPLDTAGRTALLNLLETPPAPLGWTDPLAALTLARTDAATDATGRRPAIILLTDGLPEWDAAIAPPPVDEYANALQAEAVRLAELDAPLFVVLVAPETGPDPAALAWRPVWEEVAAATPGGRVFDAVRATDLSAIYYGIAAALAGREPAAPEVIPSGASPITHTITVEPDLARLTLIALKSSTDVDVTLFMPDGRTPLADGRAIRHESGALETLWAFDDPMPGKWAVVLSGPGSVSVWKDARLKPTPTAAPTQSVATQSPTAEPTTAPTADEATPVARPSATEPSVVVTLFTPSPATSDPDPNSTESEVVSGSFPWLSLAGWGLVVVALALAAVRRRRGQRSGIFAGGLLRPLDPAFKVIDLDSLRRPHLTLGAPPADIVVPGWRNRVELAPGHAPAGDLVIVMRALNTDSAAAIYVNGRLLAGEHPLRDMDVIACGPVALRYENLHARPDDWAAPEEDDLQVLFE